MSRGAAEAKRSAATNKMLLKPLFRRDDGRLSPVGFIVLGVIVVSLIPLAFLVAFEVFWIYQFRVNEPKAAIVEADLEKEFRAIRPLPEAIAIGFNVSHKTNQALASDTYRTSLKYAEIRDFYDQELAKHGWTLYEEEQMKDWGKDLGGKSARYCKGTYRADLQYAGEGASYGWDYAFSVSWGLDAIFEKYPDTFHEAGCK
jgi:hypothetical protein